jgi:hypothetical protein
MDKLSVKRWFLLKSSPFLKVSNDFWKQEIDLYSWTKSLPYYKFLSQKQNLRYGVVESGGFPGFLAWEIAGFFLLF